MFSKRDRVILTMRPHLRVSIKKSKTCTNAAAKALQKRYKHKAWDLDEKKCKLVNIEQGNKIKIGENVNANTLKKMLNSYHGYYLNSIKARVHKVEYNRTKNLVTVELHGDMIPLFTLGDSKAINTLNLAYYISDPDRSWLDGEPFIVWKGDRGYILNMDYVGMDPFSQIKAAMLASKHSSWMVEDAMNRKIIR